METIVKIDSASTTSDQPTQPKETCFPSVKQEASGSERNLTLERRYTEADVRRMFPDSNPHEKFHVVLDSLDHKKVKVELERAKPQSAKYCQSYTGNSLQDTVQRMGSMESASQILEHGNMKKASDNCNVVEGFHGRKPRSKKPMQSSKSKTSNGLESDILPKSFLTEEDIGRVVREQLELAKPDFADHVSRLLSDHKREVVTEIRSSQEVTFRRMIREELKHALCQPAQLVRPSGTCREKNEERNFKLKFITKPPAVLYTGDKLKGERGDSIAVELVNTETGAIVQSGPQSSVNLKVVALEGGFQEGDDHKWTQEEFGKSLVKEREGRRPLLRGKLVVTLNRGTGELGDVEFTDNSKWTRSGQFRIALQPPPEHCENIREAITEAFIVKENRGKLNNKHSPPSPNDDVWQLRNIGRKGPLCKKLNEAGIDKVKDFLQLLRKDPEKLREILGKGMTENKWKDLLDHANSCRLNEKPYVCHDHESGHGVMLDNVGQRNGLTADGGYCAADKFSLKQKGKARELNAETFSGSMQKKRARPFSPQVSEGPTENATAVQPNMALLVNAGSPAEGRDGVTLAASIRSQNTNFENTEYSGDGRITYVDTEDHNVPFFEPPHASMVPCFQSRSTLPPLEGDHVMAEAQSTDTFGAWLDASITTDSVTLFDIDTFISDLNRC